MSLDILRSKNPFLWYSVPVITIMVYSMMSLHSPHYYLEDKNIATTIPTENMVILIDKPTYEIHLDKLIPSIVIVHHYQQSVSDNPSTPESVNKKINRN